MRASQKLRERATMNILTVDEPYPDITKRIVRQLLSAIERLEDAYAQHCAQCPQCHEQIRRLLTEERDV